MSIKNEILTLEESNNKLVELNKIAHSNSDYITARDNIHDIIQKGKEGLDVALTLVQGSESPRAIEVFSTLLKTLTETNMQLLELHKGNNNSNTSNQSAQEITNNVTNQAIFTGSTAELAQLITNMNLDNK